MRIRSIKPGVHLNEVLWDLEQETGLPIFRGFTGLWSAADREGRFEWRPRKLKSAILPYWEGDFSRVLDALTSRGFLVRYAILGVEYGVVARFKQHQSINHKEQPSTLPAPEEADPELNDIQDLTRGSRVENAQDNLERTDPGKPVRNMEYGREGSMENGAAEAAAPETPVRLVVERSDDPEIVAASLGRKWLGEALKTIAPDHHGRWKHALAELSRKPDAEKAVASATLAQEGSKSGKRKYLTPQHVLDYWDGYASGNPPGGFAPSTGTTRYAGPSAVLKPEAYSKNEVDPW